MDCKDMSGMVMLQGKMEMYGKEYPFHINERTLCFQIERSEFNEWYHRAKQDHYQFKQTLWGICEDGKRVQMKTVFFSSLPGYDSRCYGMVGVYLEHAVLWDSWGMGETIIDGICVKFLALNNTSKQEDIFPSGIDEEKWTYVGEQFWWRGQHLDVENALSISGSLSDTFRFLCQMDFVGQIELHFFTKGKHAGKVWCAGFLNPGFYEASHTSMSEIVKIISPEEFAIIYQAICEQNLYMLHLEEYPLPKRFTSGWFLNVTAAFEWETERFDFHIEHTEQSKEEQRIAIDALEEVRDKIRGSKKTRKHFKEYIDAIKYCDEAISLGEKIQQLLKYNKLEPLWRILIPHVYQLYPDAVQNDKSTYQGIADRIQYRRNAYAHGMIERELNPLAFIDASLLRRMLYIIQLDRYNIKEETIISLYETAFSERPFSLNRLEERLQQEMMYSSNGQID